jgi:hypothetical protein
MRPISVIGSILVLLAFLNIGFEFTGIRLPDHTTHIVRGNASSSPGATPLPRRPKLEVDVPKDGRLGLS